MKRESESRSVVSDSLLPRGLHSPWNCPGLKSGGGSLSLLQGSSQPRGRTQGSCTAGGFFTRWATREAQNGTELKVKCIRIQTNTHICVPAHICEPTVVEGLLLSRKYISNVKGGKRLNLVNQEKKFRGTLVMLFTL